MITGWTYKENYLGYDRMEGNKGGNSEVSMLALSQASILYGERCKRDRNSKCGRMKE